MATPPSPGFTAPLDTLRLSQEDKRKLIAYVEGQGRTVSDSRRRLRIDFHGRKVFGRLSSAEGQGPLCALVPRNLSAGGFSFVHGAFVNAGMRCRLTLPMLGNRWCEVDGTVRRCRHVQGIVHEVSLVFDEELDLAEMAPLTPDQRRRLASEALAGRGVGDGEGKGGNPQPASGRGRVLVVDADPAGRDALAAALRLAGFTHTACGSNHAAREALRSEFPAGPPVAAVLSGKPGPVRAGVAELRFDPVALASHLRRERLAGPILLRPADPADAAAAATLQRRAAVAGITEVLSPGLVPAEVAAAVTTHLEHLASARSRAPLLSLLADRPGTEEQIDRFIRRIPGHRERLRRPGTTERPEALRVSCEDLIAAAAASGFPAVADAARLLLAAVATPVTGGVPAALAELDGLLARVQAGHPGPARAAA